MHPRRQDPHFTCCDPSPPCAGLAGSVDLEQKVSRHLDARGEIFTRYWYERGSAFINRWSFIDQLESDAQLLALAAEVAAASAGSPK